MQLLSKILSTKWLTEEIIVGLIDDGKNLEQVLNSPYVFMSEQIISPTLHLHRTWGVLYQGNRCQCEVIWKGAEAQ